MLTDLSTEQSKKSNHQNLHDFTKNIFSQRVLEESGQGKYQSTDEHNDHVLVGAHHRTHPLGLQVDSTLDSTVHA